MMVVGSGGVPGRTRMTKQCQLNAKTAGVELKYSTLAGIRRHSEARQDSGSTDAFQ
jgi:hypothetical protein